MALFMIMMAMMSSGLTIHKPKRIICVNIICVFIWGQLFKTGRHLGYWNGKILEILNLNVATMPPTKFQLNPIYGFGKDVQNVKS